jgi:hypothetical protein
MNKTYEIRFSIEVVPTSKANELALIPGYPRIIDIDQSSSETEAFFEHLRGIAANDA